MTLRRSRPSRRGVRALVAFAVASTAFTVGTSHAAPPLSIRVMSNRADLISGGDAVVAVDLPAGVASSSVTVVAGADDVTAEFALRPNGLFEGLLTGLPVGETVVRATSHDASGAQITITDHSNDGPLFSGPQMQPWYCAAGTTGPQCDAPVKYTWYYQSNDAGACNGGPWLGVAGNSTCFLPYDPAHPPSDVMTTKTDEGKTVPYIVRVETGTQDRDLYQIAVLMQPDEHWTRWTGPPAWDHKLRITHGAGCSTNHKEGNAPPPGVLSGTALSRGYAVLSTALDDDTENCGVVVQAESLVMAKEHLIDTYGDVRFTQGDGCSGGSLASLEIANAYPGIYDGLTVSCTYPDVPVNDLVDCPTLTNYWDDPTKWGSGVAWTPDQMAAAAGLASTSVCEAYIRVFGLHKLFDPRAGYTCNVPAAEVYDPSTDPGGVRCSWQDYLSNVFGFRTPDRWGAIESSLGHGFANRPYDNVGVQYGLRALMNHQISQAQFVDLNTKVGSLDIDYNAQPSRVEADPAAIAADYRSGAMNEANNLGGVAIIDQPGLFPGDRYEIHDNYKSWALRARLDAAYGGHSNQVIWTGPERQESATHPASSFALMDAWLTAVTSDTRDVPREQKVAQDRPSSVHDECQLPDQATCQAFFGSAGNIRWGAGEGSLANDVVKCNLKPLRRNDYAPILFTDEQWAALQSAFPAGVCDWTKPGVAQQPTVSWMQYGDASSHTFGGAPLGPPPQSESL